MSEEQPRVPAGSSDGGEWTSGAGGSVPALKEKLSHAKAEVARLDQARQAAPDDSPQLPQLNKEYFKAQAEEGKIYQELRKAEATPSQRQGMSEQSEANRLQREATQRLAEKDHRPASTPESRKVVREADDTSHGASG